MERVQYALERSLPQLQLLDREGILSKEELRSVTSQRRGFEARLIRRKAEKHDFVLYLEFEEDLNQLILLRARTREREAAQHARERGESDKAKLLPRQFFAKQAASFSAVCLGIYERMVRKFRWDVDCWERYLSFAKMRRMRTVAGRVYARALALHPKVVPLWLSAADYELNANADTTAARALLQRGLRMNPLTHAGPEARGSKQRRGARASDESPVRWDPTPYEMDVLRLWLEYFRMELVFIERLRRRWKLLGLDAGEASVSAGDQDANAFRSARRSAQAVRLDAADSEGADDSEEEGADDVEGTDEALAEEEEEAEAGPDEDDPEGAQRGTAPAAGASAIPRGHQSVMHGSIPLVLLTSLTTMVPAQLQLYLYVGLFSLLASFPFFDSVVVSPSGAVQNLRQARDAPLGTGDELRNRLIGAVLEALEQTSEEYWADDGRVAAQALLGVHPLVHPFSHDARAQLTCNRVDVLGAALLDDELEHNTRLRAASEIHPRDSEAIDALYPMSRAPVAMQTGVDARGKMCRGVLLVAEYLSAHLVQRHIEEDAAEADAEDATEEEAEEVAAELDAGHVKRSAAIGPDEPITEGELVKWTPTPLLSLYARTGDLPALVQAVVLAFRERAAEEDDAALALAFLAVLRCLRNPTRAGIEEANLQAYLARVAQKDTGALLDGAEGPALAWLAVERLSAQLDTVSDAAADTAAIEALCSDAQDAVARFPEHPGTWALQMRAARFAAQHAPSAAGKLAALGDAWTDDTPASPGVWQAALDACTRAASFAQDAGASVWPTLLRWLECAGATLPAEEATLAEPDAAREALWMDYIEWVVSAAHGATSKRRAARWAWGRCEAAVMHTGAVLASSQLLGTARAHAQALHDAVVRRFFLFASSEVARCTSRAASTEEQLSETKDRVLAFVQSRSSASVTCWLQLAALERLLLEMAPASMHAAAAARAERLYRHAAAQSERGCALEQEDGAAVAAAVDALVDTWLAYLGFLAQRDTRRAMEQLRTAQDRVRAAGGAAALDALQRGWEQLVA